MPRVLIVDDHAILRRGLRRLLDTHPGWECCGEAESGEEAIRAVAKCSPDVITMDVSMPGMGGLKATKLIHENFPAIKILLFTLHQSIELLRAAFLAGASGYVLKSDIEDDLIDALQATNRGEVFVTRSINPVAVAELLKEIRRPKEIAGNGAAKIAKAQL